MFPSLSEYNKTIQVQGASAFRTLNNIFFIPARTTPIKIYSFGSGSFAVVFKALENNKEIAIRCFIGTDADYVDRYRKIDRYLKSINENWKTNIQFLENEIKINGKLFPVVKMDWVEGKLLDKFINRNLDNNRTLSELQQQIFETSRNLEKNKIAHGDIQCGNILIEDVQGKPIIKLIDYDGMYIPDFQGQKQTESGRSEFQHPKRREFAFNERIDRFSFWVILCALEALKFDKTLWREIMQGGFNTLDNLLFVASDFTNPNQSRLFKRLESLNQPALNFYLDKLKYAVFNNSVDEVRLYGQNESIESDKLEKSTINTSITTNSNRYVRLKITSTPPGVSVRDSFFNTIGTTPLVLNKYDYLDKEIKVVYGKNLKSIIINESSNDIYIDFDKIIGISSPEEKKKEEEKKESSVPPINKQKKDDSGVVLFFAVIIFILIAGFGIYKSNEARNNSEYDSGYDGESVQMADTTAVAADTMAVPLDTTAYPAEDFTDTDKAPTVLPVDTTAVAPNPSFNDFEKKDIAYKLGKSYFVGKWSIENMIYTFYSNGDLNIEFKTNGGVWGNTWVKWQFVNGKLYLGLGNNDSLLRYFVLDSTTSYFSYFPQGDNSEYNAFKITD